VGFLRGGGGKKKEKQIDTPPMDFLIQIWYIYIPRLVCNAADVDIPIGEVVWAFLNYEIYWTLKR
jgi:hypothetical protein